MDELHNYLHTAICAAKEAAYIHKSHLNRELEIETKSTYADLVTKVDKDSEAKIREIINSTYPNHTILGEEEGQKTSSSHRWIVDPLDGTINYAHGFPFYCVSIALEIDSKLQVGVVLDSYHDELFTAIQGQGAYCNGSPVLVSKEATLSKALLATGFSYNPEMIDQSLALFKKVLLKCRSVRRPGAAALDLCYVACGRLDGFWEAKLNPWDVAAGVLIIQEAGGSVTDAFGGPYHLDNPIMIASNGHLHLKLVGILGLEQNLLESNNMLESELYFD